MLALISARVQTAFGEGATHAERVPSSCLLMADGKASLEPVANGCSPMRLMLLLLPANNQRELDQNEPEMMNIKRAARRTKVGPSGPKH